MDQDETLKFNVRIPSVLTDYIPLLGVGLTHMIALGEPSQDAPDGPKKWARIKLSGETLQRFRVIQSDTGQKNHEIITKALQRASMSRLNP